MVNISKEQFLSLKGDKKQFSLISTFRGDYITPINIYKSFKGKYKFLFESGSEEGRSGRYSFIGENPKKVLLSNGNDGFNEIKKIIDIEFEKDTNPFPFKGGVISFISYEIVRSIHKKLSEIKKGEFSECGVSIYDEYICYDSFTHKVSFVTTINLESCLEYEEILKSHKDRLDRINDFRWDYRRGNFKSTKFKRLTTKESFIEKVKCAKKYIEKGDIFQVVLSIREECETNKPDFEIYRRLREDNPSSYMYLVEFGEFSIIGSSPESLVSLEGGIIQTNPIAGTRKRGGTLEEDNKLELELINDDKEKSEHVMLVDLGRNDISNVSKTGSTKVTSFMKVRRYSHVMHITSIVEGEIREGNNAISALKACLPSGTVSGAPKIRAMEIIDELEDYSRGIYSGGVGYFSYGGNMDMSIGIRTILLKGSRCLIQGGAGIVFDSVPELEFEEINNKLMILREALK